MEGFAVIVSIVTSVQAWLAGFPFLGLLLTLIALDIVTGILRAFRDRAVSSDVSTAGITRKAAILIAVLLGYMLEPYGLPVGTLLAVSYCASEGMSLLENLALLGAPVPPIVQDYFSKLAANAPNKNVARPVLPDLLTRPSATVEQPAPVVAAVEDTQE